MLTSAGAAMLRALLQAHDALCEDADDGHVGGQRGAHHLRRHAVTHAQRELTPRRRRQPAARRRQYPVAPSHVQRFAFLASAEHSPQAQGSAGFPLGIV